MHWLQDGHHFVAPPSPHNNLIKHSPLCTHREECAEMSTNPFNQELSSSNELYPKLKEDKPELEEEKPAKSKDTYTEDIGLFVKASDFAARRHRFQKRKDPKQTPYINHPIGNLFCVSFQCILLLTFIGVAYLLTSIGHVYDSVTLAAAVLHDVVEDTKTTHEEIEHEFGSEIAKIVHECTVDKSLARDRRKQLEVEEAGNCSHKVRSLLVTFPLV